MTIIKLAPICMDYGTEAGNAYRKPIQAVFHRKFNPQFMRHRISLWRFNNLSTCNDKSLIFFRKQPGFS
jgi:hypothetical protein